MITKKCTKCGKEKDVPEFYRGRTTCKQCIKDRYAQRTEKEREHTRKWNRENRRKNRERDREKNNEYMKLYMRTYGRTYNFLRGNGCCLYCWETNPFMLNNHHIWGRKNDDFTITLCECHHAAFTRHIPFVLTKWTPSSKKE